MAASITCESFIDTLCVDTLPPTPGKITLKWQAERTERVFKTSISQAFHLCSRSYCCGNADRTVVCKPHPSYGWNIKTDSVNYHIIHAQGKYIEPEQENGAIVAWKVKTFRSNEKELQPGSLTFQMCFSEWQDVVRIDEFEEEIPLTWGESTTFHFPQETWAVVFQELGNNRIEFTKRGTQSSKYLKVNTINDWISIEVINTDASDPCVLKV